MSDKTHEEHIKERQEELQFVREQRIKGYNLIKDLVKVIEKIADEYHVTHEPIIADDDNISVEIEYDYMIDDLVD